MHGGSPPVCPPSPSVARDCQIKESTVLSGAPPALFARGLPRPTFGGVGVNVGRANSVRRDFAMVSPDATVAGRARQLVGGGVLSSCTVGLGSLPATALAF